MCNELKTVKQWTELTSQNDVKFVLKWDCSGFQFNGVIIYKQLDAAWDNQVATLTAVDYKGASIAINPLPFYHYFSTEEFNKIMNYWKLFYEKHK